MAGGFGAKITRLPGETDAHAALFGEDQARYLVTIDPQKLEHVSALALADGVVLTILGTVSGSKITVPGEAPIEVASLRDAHESWLPRFMGSGVVTH